MEILLDEVLHKVRRRGVFFMSFFRNLNRVQRKLLWGVTAVFLLAAAFHGITERAFLAQASMEGAFANLSPEYREGTVTLTGQYLPPAYGFSEEKLLGWFGEQIGLTVDGELREAVYEGRREVIYEKQAAYARSVLKIVYLPEPEQYYLCAEVTLTGENADKTADFRKQLCHAAERMGLRDIITTLELCGGYPGELPLGEKDRVTDLLLSELYAQPVYENRENKNYTVYAYTGAVEEYITVEKKKINVQVAIYYDKDTDCTEVVLASPLGLR